MKTNNFSKLSWEPCEIFHNTAYAYTKRCIIGIPIYKSKLKETEKASLNQLCKVIGHSYEICLICPDNIELNEYIDIAYSNGVYLSYLFCGNEYFKSTETYSYMLETPDFYNCFNEYDYLMIYQLDGWIFVNFLDYYIDLNVDYIGSPWRTGILHFNEDTVGNGGVSLRRVQKFINVCSKFTSSDYQKQHVENEDLFFCKTMRKQINLKFADIKNASNFSLQSNWQYFINKYNDKHLPMCLHAWHRDYNVLEKYIKIEYNNTKHLTNDKITYDNLINYQKFKNLNFTNRKEKKEKQEIVKKEQIKKDNKQMKIFKSNFFTWSSYLKYQRKTNLKQIQIKEKKEIKQNNDYENNNMNIISNNCLAGLIYHEIKQIYPNQFIFVGIDLDDFIYLIENYNNINFSNVNFDLEYRLSKTYKSVVAIVDNKIKIHFSHYQEDKTKDKITKYDDSYNVYYKNIIDYAKNKWFERLKRNNNKPTFLYSFNSLDPNSNEYYEILNRLFSIKKESELTIIIHDDVVLNNVPDNIKVIRCKKNVMELKDFKLGTEISRILFNKNKVALCGIAKQENKYLREWVEHYKKIGVDKIFLYDNNDINGEVFDDVISDYINDKFVEVINVRGKEAFQLNAYNECYQTYLNEFDWAMFFDIDEYLILEKQQDIHIFLNQNIFSHFQIIRVNWLIYDDNDMLDVVNNNYSIVSRFTRPVNNHPYNRHCKTIIRCGLKNTSFKENPHFMNSNYLACDASGIGIENKSMFNKKPIFSGAWLNHYPTKTIGEYVRGKMQRLYPDQSKERAKSILTLEYFFTYNNKSESKYSYGRNILKYYTDSKNEVTFIIPNRGGKNIDYVINNFNKTFNDIFDGIRFIVITQDDNMDFKRGQLFNIAFKFVDTKWIGLIDNDIFNINKINLINEYNKHNKPLLMFDKISQIHFDENNKYIIDKTELRLAGFGAFNFMKSSDFINVNGFSNLCIGWGCEDNILDFKLKMYRIKNTLCHITHPTRQHLNTNQRMFNRDVYYKYKNGEIKNELDGLSQTTYTVTKKEYINNVMYISVKNIGVCNDFYYEKLYKTALSYEKKNNL